MMVVAQWGLGLMVSLLLGHFAAKGFRDWRTKQVNKCGGNSDKTAGLNLPDKRLPAVTGCLERLFFSAMIGFDVSGSGVAMMAWLAVKMGANWQRHPCPTLVDRAGAMTALQSGLVSMLFAVLGGIICKREPCIPTWLLSFF